MKKWVALLVALCAVITIAAGCSQKSFKDGIYTAEMSDYDAYGYKEYLIVTVKDSVIVQVEFDAKTASGAKRSQDREYYENMTEAMGEKSAEYGSALVHQYLEKQTIKEVDTVVGATLSSDNFKAMFKELESRMQKGKTELVVVTAPQSS